MKAILIDDEQLALDFLEIQLNKTGMVDIIDKLTDPVIGLERILSSEVDVVFLDIQMPEINGLLLAEKILTKKPQLAIVFVTAYDHYAVQAFELNTLDYVVKPVQLDRLQKTLNRVVSQIKQQARLSSVRSSSDKMRVQLFHEFAVELEDGMLEPLQWRTKKAQELFLYLMQHIGQTIRKSELADLLWPELDERRAYAHLYTNIYHVRKKLTEIGSHFAIENTTEGYILQAEQISIDTAEWEKRILTLPEISKQTISTYEEAMELYHGGYLQTYDYIWAEPERYRLEQLWLKTAFQIADFYYDNAAYRKAEIWYEAIMRLRSEDERAYFALMKVYEKMGCVSLVAQQFANLKNMMKEQLNLPVSSEIEQWYNKWKNKQRTH